MSTKKSNFDTFGNILGRTFGDLSTITMQSIADKKKNGEISQAEFDKAVDYNKEYMSSLNSGISETVSNLNKIFYESDTDKETTYNNDKDSQKNTFVKDKDFLVEYYYKIDSMYILIKNESIEIPVERIRNFKIINDYERASFPIFGLSMLIEPSRYYKIINNKSDVRFKIRIQLYASDKNTHATSMTKDFVNTYFKLYSEDYNDDYESNLKKSMNRDLSNDTDINELDKLGNEVEFYLFKPFINGMRSTINTVLTNTNLTTAIAYLLSKAGVTNTLLSPLDNTKVYDSIVIPPLTIDKALKYLNNNFGFHKYGTMIFFDLDRNYIINFKEKYTAWEDKEVMDTVLFVLDKSENQTYQPGCIIKPEQVKNYYNISSESINISNNSITKNVLSGTDLTLIDSNKNTVDNIITGVNVVGDTNKSIMYNDFSNSYLGNVYSMTQYANNSVISLITAGLNLKHFTPNKAFTFVFQDININKKYTGVYRLTSAIHNFVGSGLRYDLTSTLIFKKISGVNENNV